MPCALGFDLLQRIRRTIHLLPFPPQIASFDVALIVKARIT